MRRPVRAQQEPAGERALDGLGREVGVGLARLRVADQDRADEEALAADVADRRVPPGQRAKAVEEPLARTRRRAAGAPRPR